MEIYDDLYKKLGNMNVYDEKAYSDIYKYSEQFITFSVNMALHNKVYQEFLENPKDIELFILSDVYVLYPEHRKYCTEQRIKDIINVVIESILRSKNS